MRLAQAAQAQDKSLNENTIQHSTPPRFRKKSLLRNRNKLLEVTGEIPGLCCRRAGPSGKLAATSPQGGLDSALSQTRDAIAPRGSKTSKEIQHA
jgi:hypothetical protein